MNRKKKSSPYLKVLSQSSPPYSNPRDANNLHSNTSFMRPKETPSSVSSTRPWLKNLQSETNFRFNSSCPQTMFENYNSRYKQCVPFPPPDKPSNCRMNVNQPRRDSNTSIENSNASDHHFSSYEFSSQNKNQAATHTQKNLPPLLPTPRSNSFYPKHSQAFHKTHSNHSKIPQLMSLNTEMDAYDKVPQSSPNKGFSTSTHLTHLRTSTESFNEFRNDNLIRKPYLENSNYLNRSEPIENTFLKDHSSSDDLPSLIECLEKENPFTSNSLSRDFEHSEKYNDREIKRYDDRERSPLRHFNSHIMATQFSDPEISSRRNIQFEESITNRPTLSLSNFDDCSSVPSHRSHSSRTRFSNQMSNSGRKIPLLRTPYVRVNDCFESDRDASFSRYDLPNQLETEKFDQKGSSMDKEIKQNEEDLRIQLLRLKQAKIEERLRELDRKSKKTNKELSLLESKSSLF